MMRHLGRLLDALCSMRLTLICLAAGFVLVFAGTLAQVRFGLYFVQEEYFQSWLVWWHASSGNFRMPVFPGGHAIGAVLLLNLIAAHIRLFAWSWEKVGTQLTHFGLIIMLAGGLATDLFSVNSYMRIREGETKNYSEDSMRTELAVIDHTHPELDDVTSIPGERLAQGGGISYDSLPFRIEVRGFYRNSRLVMVTQGGAAVPASTMGTGQRVSVTALPRATKLDERDVMSAVIEIISNRTQESLGSWLVSDSLAAAQNLELDGRRFSIQLRPKRYYKPYSLRLLEFTHETYPGTRIPKNFSSTITLTDPEIGDSRQVLIYMNHPLRYRGDTFYQSGYDRDNSGTILQVVRNPSYQAPYIACLLMSLGMTWQFTLRLAGFARRNKPSSAA